MKKRNAVLAVMLAAGMMLTACGNTSAPAPEKAPETNQTSEAAAPEAETTGPKDEVVTMAIISSWDTLNIYNTAGNYGNCVADQMFDRMVTAKHDGVYEPRLADSWEMAEDNMSMTFHMNPDAKWHDGEPVTAEDVVFTLQAVTNEAVDNYYRAEFSGLEGCDETGICQDPAALGVFADDEHTVTIRFNAPKAESNILASLNSYMYILPKHILDNGDLTTINGSDFWNKPIGSGPFKFVSTVAGEEVTYEANTDYFLGCPDFKTLVVRVVPAASLTAGLLNGEIDVTGAGSIPLADWETVKTTETVTAASIPGYSYQYMEFNLSDDDQDWQNPAVRVAIDQAVNKKMIVDNLMQGEGELIVGPMPSYHPYYNEALVGHDFAPEAAKSALETAGFNFGKTYRLIVPQGNQVREQSALIIQQNLKDIGINVEIETYDFPTLLEMMRKGDFDLGLLGGGSNIDPAESSVIVKPHAAQNYSLLTDSKWYDLAAAGSALVDFQERKEAFNAYQAALVEDEPYIWLYSQNNLWAHSNRIAEIPMDDFIWYNYEVWTWKLAE